jgi:surface antigen
MKKILLSLVILISLFTYSYASEDYNMQKGTAIGAIGGALIGQAIGHNTAGTLIGAAGGALVGALAGNVVDQNQTHRKIAQASNIAYASPLFAEEPPPGQWVEVPGEWVNGKWVPAHKVWLPVNPGESSGEVSANIQYTPPPAYVISNPPPVVLIPGMYTYFVPGISIDILFYHGHWYRPFEGRWYRAQFYNGPWVYLPRQKVPHVLITLPPGYRKTPPEYHPIPHAELQKNWGRWEREKYWDSHKKWREERGGRH